MAHSPLQIDERAEDTVETVDVTVEVELTVTASTAEIDVGAAVLEALDSSDVFSVDFACTTRHDS